MNERFVQITKSMITDTNLDTYEYRILSYLISCSKDGKCYPSQNTIAKELKISGSLVKTRLESLTTKKYIYKTNRVLGTGKKTSNLYTLDKKLIVTKEYREEEKENQSVELYDYDWINKEE